MPLLQEIDDLIASVGLRASARRGKLAVLTVGAPPESPEGVRRPRGAPTGRRRASGRRGARAPRRGPAPYRRRGVPEVTRPSRAPRPPSVAVRIPGVVSAGAWLAARTSHTARRLRTALCAPSLRPPVVGARAGRRGRVGPVWGAGALGVWGGHGPALAVATTSLLGVVRTRPCIRRVVAGRVLAAGVWSIGMRAQPAEAPAPNVAPESLFDRHTGPGSRPRQGSVASPGGRAMSRHAAAPRGSPAARCLGIARLGLGLQCRRDVHFRYTAPGA